MSRELRTKALFDAEHLLRELAETGTRRRVMLDAQTILEHYPTRFELMRICEHSPMLDSETAQNLVTRESRLPLSDATASENLPQ